MSETPPIKRTSLREMATDAIRYWEPRRFLYNGVLAAIVIGYFIAAWPASRATLSVNGLLFLFLLGVLANLCYSAAYVPDVFMQFSGYREAWMRKRKWLLLLGIFFAGTITRFFAVAFFFPAYNP